MPVFSLQCIACNTIVEKNFSGGWDFIRYQKYLEKYLESLKIHSGYSLIHTNPNLQYCECGQPQDAITPATNMQPDKYWAGQMTDHAGYVTSGSFLKRFEKQNYLERVDRSVMEEAQKNTKLRKKEKLDKNKDNLEKFLAKELAPVEISPDN